MNIYDDLFKGQKNIILKTDNYGLYEYSLSQFKKHNYNIITTKFDINSIPEGNIMTEYEEKFLNNNNVIYKIEAIRK